MKKYYLQNGTENIGPFTIEELKAKGITKNTSVWCEGMSDWTEASNVTELTGILNITPPPIKNTLPPPVINKKSRGLNIIQKIALVFLLFIIGAIIFSNMNNSSSEESFAKKTFIDSTTSEADDTDEINKREVRNSIASNIGVNTNKYTVDAFGGITNLDVTFVNNMDYQIDECEIQVDYILENGSVFKTEYLTLNNIAAHQDKTISAPDSNRGLEVNIKINFVKSKELNLCYSSLEAPVAGDIDPYKCK